MITIRYAMIRDGIVENISLWDGDIKKWQPPEDMIIIPAPDYVGINWNYDGNNWIKPTIIKPDIVQEDVL